MNHVLVVQGVFNQSERMGCCIIQSGREQKLLAIWTLLFPRFAPKLHVLAANSACFVSLAAATMIGCQSFPSVLWLTLYYIRTFDMVLPRPIRRSTPWYTFNNANLYFQRLYSTIKSTTKRRLLFIGFNFRKINNWVFIFSTSNHSDDSVCSQSFFLANNLLKLIFELQREWTNA